MTTHLFAVTVTNSTQTHAFAVQAEHPAAAVGTVISRVDCLRFNRIDVMKLAELQAEPEPEAEQ